MPISALALALGAAFLHAFWNLILARAPLTLGRGKRKAIREAVGPASIAAGLATFGAYILVLAALSRAPAASVAAVRETSVVIATVLAVPLLHERVGASRLAGAVVVVAGRCF